MASMALVGGALAADDTYGNIDPDAQGSITLHKYETTGKSTPVGNPAGEFDATGLNALEGVGFTAYPVTEVNGEALNLLTAEGWELVKDVAPSKATCEDLKAGKTTSGVLTFGAAKPFLATDAQGTATQELDLGAYVICETVLPEGAAETSAPFLVTIPFPDMDSKGTANSNGWLYNVHAYPKNTLTEGPVKTIDTQDAADVKVGDKVGYTVSSKVTTIDTDQEWKYFTFYDELADELGDAQIKKVTLGGTDLTEGTDYLVNITPEGADKTGQKVTVWLTASALKTLKGHAGEELQVEFEATLKTLPATGNLDNQAQVDSKFGKEDTENPPKPPTDPKEPPTPVDPTPTNVTREHWGPLKVTKVDGSDKSETPATLAGAKFKVYKYKNDAQAFPTGDCAAVTGKPADADVELVGEFETGADGKLIALGGLFIDKGTAATVEALNLNSSRCYVLEETVAPVGFVLPSNPYSAVKVDKTGATAAVETAIPNNREKLPDLPLTGASGKLLMMVVGGVLLVVAGGAAVVSRNRKREEA